MITRGISMNMDANRITSLAVPFGRGGLSSPPSLKHYRTNFYGNKRALLQNIASLIPQGTRTVADLFSGTGIVSWYLKYQGFRVISNDVMRYPALRLRAVVGNNGTVLDQSDLKLLTEPNPTPSDYTTRYYHRVFGTENAQMLDTWAGNIRQLDDPLKKAIATFIPITCIQGHLKYAAIHFTAFGGLTGDQTLAHFNLQDEFCSYALNVFPRLVFNNGSRNECYQMDAVELLPHVQAETAYFDPPYVCRAGCYEGHYAFLDDLVSILTNEGHLISNFYDANSDLEPYTYFGSRRSAVSGIVKLFERSSHIDNVIFSYNTTSGITPSEIGSIAKVYGRRVSVTEVPRPRPTTQTNRNTHTQEVLMLCN